MKINKKIVDEFLQSLEMRGLASLTVKRNADNLKYFRQWLRVRRVNRENLRGFVRYFQKNHKAATVNSAISTLKNFCRFLFEEKLIKEELWESLHAMKPDPFDPILMTPTDMAEIINCPRDWGKYHKWVDRRRYDFYFELLACLALRRSEALNLKVGSFNFVEDNVRIHGKGDKIRTLPLPHDLRDRLFDWFFLRNAMPTDWAFQFYNGKRSGYATFADELKKRLGILGLDSKISFHTFRRSWITEAIKAGLPIAQIMEIVGHSDFQTLRKYYRLQCEDLRETMNNHPMNRPTTETLRQEKIVDFPIFAKSVGTQVN